MIYLLISIFYTTCSFFTPVNSANYHGYPQEISFSSHTVLQDTSSRKASALAAEEEENVYELSLWRYRRGTPLTLMLFNEQTNKLLSREEVVVAPWKNKLQIPIKKYVKKGVHSFRLVVTNQRKQRNKVYFFSR